MWASFLEKMIEDATDLKLLQYENCNFFVTEVVVSVRSVIEAKRIEPNLFCAIS